MCSQEICFCSGAPKGRNQLAVKTSPQKRKPKSRRTVAAPQAADTLTEVRFLILLISCTPRQLKQHNWLAHFWYQNAAEYQSDLYGLASFMQQFTEMPSNTPTKGDCQLEFILWQYNTFSTIGKSTQPQVLWLNYSPGAVFWVTWFKDMSQRIVTTCIMEQRGYVLLHLQSCWRQ